jgi:Tfp pilus assembly protein PilF
VEQKEYGLGGSGPRLTQGTIRRYVYAAAAGLSVFVGELLVWLAFYMPGNAPTLLKGLVIVVAAVVASLVAGFFQLRLERHRRRQELAEQAIREEATRIDTERDRADREREARLGRITSMCTWPLPVISDELDPFELHFVRASEVAEKHARHANSPEYIKRDIDPLVDSSMKPGRLALILGAPGLGKSRSAFAACRRNYDGHPIIIPRPTTRIRELLQCLAHEDLALQKPVVLWLDRIDVYLTSLQLESEDFTLMREMGIVAVGTIWPEKFGELTSARTSPNDDARKVLAEIAARPLALLEPRRPSDSELADASLKYPGLDFGDGLGQTFLATEQKLRLFQCWLSEEPAAFAVLLSAINWQRCGLERPATEDELYSGFGIHMELVAPATKPSKDCFSGGLARAAERVETWSPLLEWRVQGDVTGYRAFDPLVTFVGVDPEFASAPLRKLTDPMWSWVHASARRGEEYFSIGSAAYNAGALPASACAFRELMNAGVALGAIALGEVLARSGEFGDASATFERGIELAERGPLHALSLRVFADNLATYGKDYDQAQVMYERALDVHPTDAVALMNYASLLSDHRKEYDRAQEMFERALEANPNDALAQVNYANFLSGHRKEYDRAEEFYKSALDADPTNASSLMNYAVFLTDQRKNYDLAEAMFLQGLKIDPTHADNLGNYAVFLVDPRRDYDRAEEMYVRALDADPTNADNLGTYAWFLADQRKDCDRAEAMYERALQSDPSHIDTLHSYAAFLANQRKDYDRAEAMYERALQSDPSHIDTLHSYAAFLANQRRDYDRVEAIYERVLAADPTNATVLLGYAVFLKQGRKDYERAEAIYERALTADPTYPDALGSYANFLADQRGDNAGAEAMYKRALEIDAGNAANLANYACFLAQQRKDYQAAEALHARAMEADPMDVDILRSYAWFLANLRKDYDRAETMYERALATDPTNATVLLDYALFLKERRKDYDRAQIMYERALAADPTNATVLLDYAIFLKGRRKDYDRAQIMYERAVTADATNADALGSYALFLADQRGDDSGAEAMYRRALEIDANSANTLANYAQLLFGRGEDEGARRSLAAAIQNAGSEDQSVRLELAVYEYCHVPASRVRACENIRLLIGKGARSEGWNFCRNVDRLRNDDPDEASFIEALASVIADGADASTLNAYRQWAS